MKLRPRHGRCSPHPAHLLPKDLLNLLVRPLDRQPQRGLRLRRQAHLLADRSPPRPVQRGHHHRLVGELEGLRIPGRAAATGAGVRASAGGEGAQRRDAVGICARAGAAIAEPHLVTHRKASKRTLCTRFLSRTCPCIRNQAGAAGDGRGPGARMRPANPSGLGNKTARVDSAPLAVAQAREAPPSAPLRAVPPCSTDEQEGWFDLARLVHRQLAWVVR